MTNHLEHCLFLFWKSIPSSDRLDKEDKLTIEKIDIWI